MVEPAEYAEYGLPIATNLLVCVYVCVCVCGLLSRRMVLARFPVLAGLVHNPMLPPGLTLAGSASCTGFAEQQGVGHGPHQVIASLRRLQTAQTHAEIARLKFEELRDRVDAPADVRVEAGYNLGLLLEWRGQPDRADGLFGMSILKPYALFGLNGMDSIIHSLFWSLLFNTACFFIISICKFLF